MSFSSVSVSLGGVVGCYKADEDEEDACS